MYYTIVSGWMVNYGWKFASGQFAQISEPAAIEGVYNNMLSNPLEMLLFTGIMVIGGFLVCSIGLKNGIERVTKFMMLALLVLIVVLAVNSLTLKGAA